MAPTRSSSRIHPNSVRDQISISSQYCIESIAPKSQKHCKINHYNPTSTDEDFYEGETTDHFCPDMFDFSNIKKLIVLFYLPKTIVSVCICYLLSVKPPCIIIASKLAPAAAKTFKFELPNSFLYNAIRRRIS